MVLRGVDEVRQEDGTLSEGRNEGKLRERVLVEEVSYELLQGSLDEEIQRDKS